MNLALLKKRNILKYQFIKNDEYLKKLTEIKNKLEKVLIEIRYFKQELLNIYRYYSKPKKKF